MNDTREVTVRHDIQVAHRLLTLPGKCQRIHGHTMDVVLTLSGRTTSEGYLAVSGFPGTIVEPLDFGEVKRVFRGWLDDHWDHHLLLNALDPWVQPIMPTQDEFGAVDAKQTLPGLVTVPGDPSVENMAQWCGQAMQAAFGSLVKDVTIWETATNAVTWYA